MITGETGAGKSIILGALGLFLETGPIFCVEKKDKKCIVEGIFEIKNYNLILFLKNNDLDYDDLTIFDGKLPIRKIASIY